MNILEKIVEKTQEDLSVRKRQVSASDFTGYEDYERDRRDFKSAITRDQINIIAEIKKASPSKGLLQKEFHPLRIADDYVNGGAAAISVLTNEPFFQGKLQHMKEVSRQVEIPVLRKDFIIDYYQVVEARAWGADAILLIATILDASQIQELLHAANEIGLQALVECYDENDLKKVDLNRTHIVGVNNRNLKTFNVDLQNGLQILASIPDHIVKVSESGISDVQDIRLLVHYGIHAALIGEHLMIEKNRVAKLQELRLMSN